MGLRKTDLVSKSAIDLENMLREVVGELRAIRSRNGGTFANVSKADAERVRELNRDMRTLGEALDDKRAEGGFDRLFEHFDRVLNEVAPDGQHPGHGRPNGAPAERIQPVASLYRAMRDAGFKFGQPGQRVTVPAGVLWAPDLQAAVTTFGPDTIAPQRAAQAIIRGHDRRYVYPALQSDPLGQAATAVDFVRQSARSLATPVSMRRALAATSTKPESALTLELAHATLEQIAHKISGVPNVVARQPAIRPVIENDLRLGLAEALDAQAVAVINAAGLTAGGTGSSIAARIRKAMTVVEAAGFSPNTVALSPADAEALDLELLAILNSTNTLPNSGLNVRVGKSVTTGFAFDRGAFATVHAKPAEIAAFEENDGASNSQLFRAEMDAMTTVDQAGAAAALGAAV